MNIQNKREILAGAARYDVACASSGSRRGNSSGWLGNDAPSNIYKNGTRSFWAILPTKKCYKYPRQENLKIGGVL